MINTTYTCDFCGGLIADSDPKETVNFLVGRVVGQSLGDICKKCIAHLINARNTRSLRTLQI